MNILSKIENFLGSSIGVALVKICTTIETVFKYLYTKNKQKQEKEKQKEIQKEKNKIDDVCNNGSLTDLFDLTSK